MGHLKKVDWENLAKNLQEALSREMKENEMLRNDIADLNDQIERRNQKLCDLRSETFDSIAGIRNKEAIICYLENRLYEEMAKNRRIQDDEIPF